MITLTAYASVTYCCTLTPNDEEIVKKYMEDTKMTLDEAVETLWKSGKIDIYSGAVSEGDCDTREVYDCEFDDDEVTQDL